MENDIDKSKNFDHVFTKNDKNIMRRKSIQRVNNIYKDKLKHPEDSDSYNSDMFDETSDDDYFEELSEVKKITNITNITTLEPSAPPLYPCIDV